MALTVIQKYMIESEKTDIVCTRKPCLSFLLLNYLISLFLIFSKNNSMRFTASLIFCKELE